MKRSQINAILRDSQDFLAEHRFRLPPFAFWTPAQWQACGDEAIGIVAEGLGWDITDFGSGDFARVGLFLFTLRNGTISRLQPDNGKVYAEKIMIVAEGQVTPTHFHTVKAEDIINRGGGVLCVKLWNATPKDALADTPVTVAVDSIRRTLPAGGCIRLEPGESICLPQRLYHTFWGEAGRGRILVGEVSRVNDDTTDNRFLEPVGRFPAIVEDESPQHLLCCDYPHYTRFAV